MMRSARLRKTANLSDSVQQQLNKYALAAGAAGVGVLALGQPAEATIVYTPTHQSITPHHTLSLDLNNDGIADFRFRDRHLTSSVGFDHTGILSVLPGVPANKIEGYSRTNGNYASALLAGASIGPNARFTAGRNVMATAFIDTGAAGKLSSSLCNGPWCGATSRYLGLKFLIKGEIHFGWARLNVRCGGTGGTDVFAVLTGYAFETVPNKPIMAGQINDSGEKSTVGPDASLAAPAPQPAMLGSLALGSRGLSIWRREEPTGAAA